MTPARLATGLRRLDDLLDGGVPPLSATLVFGPPFLGKEMVPRQFILQGLRQGEPALLVVTTACAGDVRKQLAAIDPMFPDAEKRGLVRYVDAYSKSIGADEPDPLVTYVDGPLNLNGLTAAVNTAQAQLLQANPTHRLLLDSVSTLVAFTNPPTTFRFLQVLIGRAKRAGATSMLLLDAGMQSPTEVQMFKHLVDGLIEVRSDEGKNVIHAEGNGVTEPRGWVEYRVTDKGLELTGSFAAGRIR